MFKNWRRKREIKRQFSGDYEFKVDLSKSLPKKAIDWHCYVCGDFIAKSKATLMLCDKRSCAAKMGIVEVSWRTPTKKNGR